MATMVPLDHSGLAARRVAVCAGAAIAAAVIAVAGGASWSVAAPEDHSSTAVSTVTRSRSGGVRCSMPWLDSRMNRGRRFTSS